MFHSETISITLFINIKFLIKFNRWCFEFSASRVLLIYMANDWVICISIWKGIIHLHAICGLVFCTKYYLVSNLIDSKSRVGVKEICYIRTTNYMRFKPINIPLNPLNAVKLSISRYISIWRGIHYYVKTTFSFEINTIQTWTWVPLHEPSWCVVKYGIRLQVKHVPDHF